MGVGEVDERHFKDNSTREGFDSLWAGNCRVPMKGRTTTLL